MVSDYTPGSDRESCGCQGGRITSSRLSFAILYETPAAGAVISVYRAPAFIMVIALVTYSIPPKAVETRFSLANSGLVSLVPSCTFSPLYVSVRHLSSFGHSSLLPPLALALAHQP